MIRERVESSNLFAVGYDRATRLLEVEFRTNRNGERTVWAYQDVPADVYEDFRGSESLGRAFGAIKAAFDGRQVAIVAGDGTERRLQAEVAS